MTGMNIENKDSLKRTPLLVAAECGYLDIVHLLVDYGGDLTAKDKDMNSVLHCACYLGTRFKSERRPTSRNIEFLKVVQWMSEKSKSKAVNINWKNKQRNTPLLIAIETGNVDIVSTLLHAGADPYSINIYREDGLAIAAKKGNRKILELLLCTNSRGQSRGGSSINRRQKTSEKTLFPVSPLNVAAKIGSLESIQLLISHGICINSFDDYPFQHKGIKFYALTPLMIASILGYREIVEYLVSPEVSSMNSSGQQLQINITDRNGLTALGCACLFGHLDCLELIARSYPESLSFSYRYHDFESVPESVLRNMVNLASTEDRQETLRCLAYLITRGCPLTEKLIRKLVGRKYGSELTAHQEVTSRLKEWSPSTLGCPDVLVIVTGNDNQLCEIFCHSFILEIHSETFKMMLESPLTTQSEREGREKRFVLRFPHISQKIFQLILLWMYSGRDVTTGPEVKSALDVLMELMITSNEFFILRLQRICEQRIGQWLQSHRQMKEEVKEEGEEGERNNIINQIKELASVIHLDHLLVYLTHDTTGSDHDHDHHPLLMQPMTMKPATSSIFLQLQNQCPDGNDLNFLLEPRMFRSLGYHSEEEATSNPHPRTLSHEIDFLRQILFLRFRSMEMKNSNTLKCLGYEKLCQACLEKISELPAFSLAQFLLNMYSISNSTQAPLADDDLNDPTGRNISSPLPLLCKLLWICFSSLFEFCLFSWECLQTIQKQRQQQQQLMNFSGFHTKHLFTTTLHDFLSHDMYHLLCQHVILSQTGYHSTAAVSSPALSSTSPSASSSSSSRRILLIECEGQRRRFLHEAVTRGCLVKIDTLARLYSNQQPHHLWNQQLTLPDLNVNDLDDLLCYSYLGYLPIQHGGDDRWVHLQEMKPKIAHLTNLLLLADEYLMDSLKEWVEKLLAHDIPSESCACLFSVAASVNAIALRDAAAISFLSNFKLFLQETSPSSNSQPLSTENLDLPAVRISLFFDESIEICDFLHYILTSFLSPTPIP
jgi:ankyrin repeat protein